MPDRLYQICTKSVMDTIADPDITFDENGVCNYYQDHQQRAKLRLFQDDPAHLERILEKIRKAGKNRDYDCLIGVSGGVDSTYVAYLTKKWGLRPLAVHLDNGWNSELSVKNIEKTLNKLGIDLYTHVLDWEEFKAMQIAFLQSSTPDLEIPTDHAIYSLLFKIAAEKNIKFIIYGNNFASESILPESWSYGHLDWFYIKNIVKRFAPNLRLRNYPNLTIPKFFYYNMVRGIRIVSVLNYIHYKKEEAMKVLIDELGWQYYGGKHFESIYTRFFQGYILPTKFHIDKRKAHLSALIFSGQITREEAIKELEKPPYPANMQKEDMDYVIKKFNLSVDEFTQIMTLPNKTFRDYPNQRNLFRAIRRVLNGLRGEKLFYS
ncbi:MAG: N-acetyl sugar amidotransferase [Cyclobacteriaceae bacterium]